MLTVSQRRHQRRGRHGRCYNDSDSVPNAGGPSMSATPLTGLTSAAVEERIRQGQVNRVRRSDAAEYRDIVARNVLTLFNALVVPAAVALFLLGEWQGAVAVSGMAFVNTILGLVQEIRAKR